jgi:hypothetical protein
LQQTIAFSNALLVGNLQDGRINAFLNVRLLLNHDLAEQPAVIGVRSGNKEKLVGLSSAVLHQS